LVDRHQDVGEDRADDEVDLVALDELLGLADRHVGLQLVVLHRHCRGEPAELAARVLDAEHEAVSQLPAEHRLWAGQHRHDADLELLGLRCPGRDHARRQNADAGQPPSRSRKMEAGGMRIACLGGGPAGLYFALLMKRRDPAHAIVVVERNRPYDTFGWGVVLSDETLANLAASDPVSAETIRREFVYW